MIGGAGFVWSRRVSEEKGIIPKMPEVDVLPTTLEEECSPGYVKYPEVKLSVSTGSRLISVHIQCTFS